MGRPSVRTWITTAAWSVPFVLGAVLMVVGGYYYWAGYNVCPGPDSTGNGLCAIGALMGMAILGCGGFVILLALVGLAIVAIAVQETTVDDVAAYAQRYDLAYPIAFDASADIFDLYRVFALPTQVVIGPDGRVTNVVNGPLTVESATKLLGLPPVGPGPS